MEIEAKFEAADPNVIDRLKQAPELGGLELAAPRIDEVVDTYLDTPSRSLLAGGYVCRRRQTAGGIVMTVKSTHREPGGVARREEMEFCLAVDAPPAKWQEGPARHTVLGIIGDQQLVPLFSLCQTRSVRNVQKDGVCAAELSLDHVRVSVPGSELAFNIVEVELKEGTEEDLARLIEALVNDYGLAAGTGSKFERALTFVDQHPAAASAGPGSPSSGVTMNDRMSEAARKTLLFHFDRMRGHEKGVISGRDPDDVHDMRVATRRMRAALQVFQEFIDPRTIKPFARALRKTAKMLGNVRDLDVFGDKARSFAESLPEENRGDLDGLLHAWKNERDLRQAELVEYLDSAQYKRFRRRFARLLNDAGSLDERCVDENQAPMPCRVRHLLPVILFQSQARVLAYDDVFGSEEVPLCRYHQLRISSKGLRYTLEFFCNVLGPETEALINRVRALQDELGDLHDATVAVQVIESYLATGSWPGPRQTKQPRPTKHPDQVKHPRPSKHPERDAGPLGYLAARQNEIRDLLGTFPAARAEVSGPEFQNRLAAVIKALPSPEQT